MRKFLVSAAIIGLLAGPAFAQDREHQDQERQEQHGGRQARPANPVPHTGEHAFGMQNGGGHARLPAQPSNATREPERHESQSGARGQFHGREGQAQPQNAMRGPERHESQSSGQFHGREGQAQPNNAMRGGRPEFGSRDQHERHDFSSVRNFHRNFRAPRHFHAGRYHAPRGYSLRRWGWGEILPPAFWVRDYWIPDFAVYDLPPPPFGAIWVRVGDDALLIDRGSGEIIEVDYGVFY